jgi:hypothetical protein
MIHEGKMFHLPVNNSSAKWFDVMELFIIKEVPMQGMWSPSNLKDSLTKHQRAIHEGMQGM